MNSERNHHLSNPEPENKAYCKSGGSKLVDLSSVIVSIGDPSEKNYMVKMQELDEINAHLEKLVKLHGGNILVESEPGKGSEF